MLVRLKDLKPSSVRDFKIDPIDPEAVAALKDSIHKHGFWGGNVARQMPDGSIENVAGSTRVLAAMHDGIKEADIFVHPNMDDETAIKVYATENATQRGNSGTAVTGSVAAALRFLVRQSLTAPQLGSTPRARTDQAIGEPAVSDLLASIGGFTKRTITEQLANLKASGDYARIVEEVAAEVEVEQEAERQTLERKAKLDAKEKERVKEIKVTGTKIAKQRERVADQKQVFDLAGVSQHLRHENHLAQFRKLVLEPKIAQYVPVHLQAQVAKGLVAQAKAHKKELTARYIDENIRTVIRDLRAEEKQISDREKRDLELRNWEAKAESLIEHLKGRIRNVAYYAAEIAAHEAERPAGATFYYDADFWTAVDSLIDAVEKLKKMRGKARAA